MSKWFEQQRLSWIEETLQVFGYINREHLERKFGISTPQATNDLREFQRLFPHAVTYNASRKRYEPARRNDRVLVHHHDLVCPNPR